MEGRRAAEAREGGGKEGGTWFMNLAVKDMPNLTGMAARPRFFHRLLPLNASTAARLPTHAPSPTPPPASAALGVGQGTAAADGVWGRCCMAGAGREGVAWPPWRAGRGSGGEPGDVGHRAA